MGLVERWWVVVMLAGAACRPQATSSAELIERQQQELDENGREALDGSGPTSVEDYEGYAPGAREPSATERTCHERALAEGCTWELCQVGGGTRLEHESAGTLCGSADDGRCDGDGHCVRTPRP